MIILHPTSRCDICLDGYALASSADSPHTISCGHTFCMTCVISLLSRFISSSPCFFRCLHSLYPTICPLCRKPFHLDRIKKLHVAKAPNEPDGADVVLDSRSTVLLQRVALVSGEDSPDESLWDVLNDVGQWLSSPSNNVSLVQCLFHATRFLDVRFCDGLTVSHDRQSMCMDFAGALISVY